MRKTGCMKEEDCAYTVTDSAGLHFLPDKEILKIVDRALLFGYNYEIVKVSLFL